MLNLYIFDNFLRILLESRIPDRIPSEDIDSTQHVDGKLKRFFRQKNREIIYFLIFMIQFPQITHEKISSYINLVYGFSMQKLAMVWVDVTVTSILKIGDISTSTFQKPAHYDPDNVKNKSDFNF